MVVVVAFLLAFVSSSLKDTQTKNVELDKMKQILSALNVDTKGQNAEEIYNKYVTADPVFNVSGEQISENGGFKLNMATEMGKSEAERQLPLYICQVDGETKYVIPLSGAGLWGAIWGYVALNEDKNTVYGVYFSHESETPGLGAEITSAKFQGQFPGKKLLKDGEIALGVEKNGKVTEPDYQVDGISGGTITSKGVDTMIKNCMGQYSNFLNN
jgi:Na+-transporting NADH:ubiquinone oxidoreductase subunit C